MYIPGAVSPSVRRNKEAVNYMHNIYIYIIHIIMHAIDYTDTMYVIGMQEHKLYAVHVHVHVHVHVCWTPTQKYPVHFQSGPKPVPTHGTQAGAH